MRTKIYPFGASRVEKTTPALEQEFQVVRPDKNPVPEWFHQIGPLRMTGTLSRILTPLIRHQDDIIAVAFSFGTSALIVERLCDRLDIPFLIRIRGGMCNEFRDRALTAGESSRKARLYGAIMDYRRDVAFARADGILPISEYSRNQYFTELSAPMPPEKVQVVENPVRVERFEDVSKGQFKRALGIPKDDNLALTITSFNYRGKYRGVSYFMPAIGRILASHPNWHIAVTGDGGEVNQGQEEILSAVPEDVRDQVHLPGYWSPIRTALVDAEIAFHLSYRDAAPMTVLEEQAARLPVIVNSACGMKNLVDESNSPEDVPVVVTEPHEIEAPLETLIENPQLRSEIGNKNRNYVRSEFSSKTIGRKFQDSIRKIVRD